MSDTDTAVSFFVPGIPAPGGSKRHIGNGIMVDDAKRNVPWRESVGAEAYRAMDGRHPLHGALELVVVFAMPRPKAHYRTGKHAGELKGTAPAWHTSKPDATKLLRAVEDAMTGIVWRDDAQVCFQRVSKCYAPTAGAHVEVRPVTAPDAGKE